MTSSPGYLPLIVLFTAFAFTAIRQAGGLRLQIWQIMLMGAFIVLVTGQISPGDALKAVNLDIIVFLIGMFVVGEALVESGYLYEVSHRLFRGAGSVDSLILRILFVLGFFSAFLMNDTIAIVGTPLVLLFADRHNVSHKLLLLSLCFAATLGSVVTPIGNPQNLLIALGGGVDNPFVTFFRYLAIPTVLNLFLAYLVLKFFYRDEFHDTPLQNPEPVVKDPALAALSRLSLVLVFGLSVVKVCLVLFNTGVDFRLTCIAVAGAAPVLLISPKRYRVLRNIDWSTIVFFVAIFILMESVWMSPVLQTLMAHLDGRLGSTGVVMALSVVVSQFLSNVPFVALYLPVLSRAGSGADLLMALAAGSTIAGNLFILGAASNVIVIQAAEKRGRTLGFLDFAKAGVPLTILNVIVYWVFFKLAV